jgi:hypothetical protein
MLTFDTCLFVSDRLEPSQSGRVEGSATLSHINLGRRLYAWLVTSCRYMHAHRRIFSALCSWVESLVDGPRGMRCSAIRCTSHPPTPICVLHTKALSAPRSLTPRITSGLLVAGGATEGPLCLTLSDLTASYLPAEPHSRVVAAPRLRHSRTRFYSVYVAL